MRLQDSTTKSLERKGCRGGAEASESEHFKSQKLIACVNQILVNQSNL
jgi:hypothetical protein